MDSTQKRALNQKGFALVASLIQISLLCFVFYLISFFIYFKNLQHQTLSECFEASLRSLAENSLAPLNDFNTKLINSSQDAIFKVQISASLPILNLVDDLNQTSMVAFNLKFKSLETKKFNFFAPVSTEINFKCGAEKVCLKEKCHYSIIVDKF